VRPEARIAASAGSKGTKLPFAAHGLLEPRDREREKERERERERKREETDVNLVASFHGAVPHLNPCRAVTSQKWRPTRESG